MEYITSVEQIGYRKGIEEGMQQGMQQGIQQGMRQGIRQGLLAGIELGIDLKFGKEGLQLLSEIYEIEDVNVLRAIHQGIKTARTPDELRSLCRQLLNDTRP